MRRHPVARCHLLDLIQLDVLPVQQLCPDDPGVIHFLSHGNGGPTLPANKVGDE